MNKKAIVLFVLIFLSFNLKASTKWYYSFEEAQKVAIATNKLILVDFWATWCGPCRRMDTDSWEKDDVGLLAGKFVPLRIDIDIYKDIAGKYNVTGIPYIFIMDGNGEVVYQQMGYMSKSQLSRTLEKFALNTSYMQRDLMNY